MTRAFFNPATGAVWVQPVEADPIMLGPVADKEAALAVIAGRGYIRTGDWLPAYGDVVSVSLR